MASMDPLALMDALMLVAENVGSAMHVGALLILSPPPDITPDAQSKYVDELYRDSLTGPYNLDPRLRRYPHRGLDTGGAWVWREAAEVDLRRHLHRTVLPPGSDRESLWELVSELHSERMDMAAPLWTSWLIDGFDTGGAFALYIKVHHIVVDGVGGMRMIADSLSADPDRRGMPPFYADNGADGGGEKETDEPTGEHRSGWPLPNPLAGVRAVAEAVAAGLDLTRRVATAELATIVGSLTSDAVVAPLEAPQTRFNARLGPRRAATGTSLPGNRIHAVRNAAGVSANDVVTAVISGALRHWLLDMDELPPRSLVAMCPVSVRTRDAAGTASAGNRFGLGLCPLGTDLADPADRLALIHEAMSRIKHQVAERGADAMLAVMGPAIGSTVALPLLPLGAMMPLSAIVPPSCNLAISNVPGPTADRYLNGAHLDEIYPVSTVFDGMGLNVTVCSYADRIEVGYVTDADLMDDVAALVPLTQAALTELATAVGVSTP